MRIKDDAFRFLGMAACVAVLVLAILSAYGWLGAVAPRVVIPLVLLGCPAMHLTRPRRHRKHRA